MELQRKSIGYGVIQAFIYSLSKYLLSDYYKSGIVLASK